MRRISAARRANALRQLESRRHSIHWDTRPSTVDIVTRQFHDGVFFRPAYAKSPEWGCIERSLFIESVLLGLPVPTIYAVQGAEAFYGLLFGWDFVSALTAFALDAFPLTGIETLTGLNGFRCSDVFEDDRRYLQVRSVRMVVFWKNTRPEVLKDITARLNGWHRAGSGRLPGGLG
jgi:hypothetical protein